MNIVGRRLSLIIKGKDRNGEDEVWVHAGTVQGRALTSFLIAGTMRLRSNCFPNGFRGSNQ
jgi:hypothetical protein